MSRALSRSRAGTRMRKEATGEASLPTTPSRGSCRMAGTPASSAARTRRPARIASSAVSARTNSPGSFGVSGTGSSSSVSSGCSRFAIGRRILAKLLPAGQIDLPRSAFADHAELRGGPALVLHLDGRVVVRALADLAHRDLALRQRRVEQHLAAARRSDAGIARERPRARRCRVRVAQRLRGEKLGSRSGVSALDGGGELLGRLDGAGGTGRRRSLRRASGDEKEGREEPHESRNHDAGGSGVQSGRAYLRRTSVQSRPVSGRESSPAGAPGFTKRARKTGCPVTG